MVNVGRHVAPHTARVASTQRRPTLATNVQAVAGLAPDARQLVSRTRDEARGYRQNFGEAVLPRLLAERLGGFVHLHTVYWYLRPFGASILLAGYDSEARRHELYCVEPTGIALRYFGYAIGTWRCGTHSWSLVSYRWSGIFIQVDTHSLHSSGPLPSNAVAGKGARAAKTAIEKLKFEERTVEEALGLVAKM